MSKHLLAACVALAGLAACSQRPAPAANDEPPPVVPRAGPFFDAAFADGFEATAGDTRYRFHTRAAGDIVLTSGKLVACDVIVSCGGPFTGSVPVGSFPLRFAIATRGDDERIALARIDFAPGPISRWELAVIEGQDVTTLKRGEIFGYGVDSGTGAFLDAEALRAFGAERDRGGEAFDTRLFAEMDKTYRHTRSWHLHPTPKGTVALFSSGYGDGTYPTYKAYGKDGALVAVITDFGIVPWE